MKSKTALLLVVSVLVTFCVACSTTPAMTASPSPKITLPQQTSAAGVDLELQADNRIRVKDSDNGYAFLLSADWLPVLQGFQAVKDASNAVAATDPQIANLLESHLNDRHYRVMAFNQNENYRDETMVMKLYVQVDPMFSALPLDKAVKQFAGEAPSQGVAINKNNIEYGYINGESTREIDGKPIKLHSTVFLIKLNNSHAFFFLFMPISVAESSKDVIQELIDSVELLNE
jgi:hypothetical protein